MNEENHGQSPDVWKPKVGAFRVEGGGGVQRVLSEEVRYVLCLHVGNRPFAYEERRGLGEMHNVFLGNNHSCLWVTFVP